MCVCPMKQHLFVCCTPLTYLCCVVQIEQYREINGDHWLHCTPPEYLQSFGEEELKAQLTKCSIAKDKVQPSSVTIDDKLLTDDQKDCSSEIVNGVKVTFNVDDVMMGDGDPNEKMEEAEELKDVDLPGLLVVQCCHFQELIAIA